MKAFLSFSIALSLGVLLSGCNTVSGVGKDLKQTGNAIDNAAHQNRSTTPQQ